MDDGEKRLRNQVVKLGIGPGAAEIVAPRSEWVRQLWSRLQDVVLTNEHDQASKDRLRNSKVMYSLTTSFAATRVTSGARSVVIINLGIVEAIIECAKIYVAAIVDPAVHGFSVPPDEAIALAGLRFAHVLGWLTSVARHPVSTPEYDLAALGDRMVQDLTGGAVLFVLAHEIAHVMAGDLVQPGYERELAADAKALEILRLAANPQTINSGSNPTLAPIEVATDITVPSAALFLSFEGLRQRATGVAMYLEDRPLPTDILAATQGPDHPSPYSRLRELQKAVSRDDPDGSELAAVSAIMDGFDLLLPAVARNLPEEVVDEDEAKQWLRDSGEDPAKVAAGFKATYDTIYHSGVVNILRQASIRGSILPSDLDELQDMAGRMPRTVINALALARAGQLLPLTDQDASGVHAMGQLVAQQIEPLLLREALHADTTSIASLKRPPTL
jgi:Zn-dependent protease with chaperone function